LGSWDTQFEELRRHPVWAAGKTFCLRSSQGIETFSLGSFGDSQFWERGRLIVWGVRGFSFRSWEHLVLGAWETLVWAFGELGVSVLEAGKTFSLESQENLGSWGKFKFEVLGRLSVWEAF
jgi:hypothetical protein